MTEEQQKKEVTITRTFDAPVEKVWKAVTDQEIVAKWWGPRGVTIPVCEVDPRPGGRINIVMLAGKELGEVAGQEWPMSGTFKEVVKNDRLVFAAEALQDRNNRRTLLETRTTITFREDGGRTTMTVQVLLTKTSDAPEAKFAVQGMELGWTQQMDKLVELLTSP